jgi:hypothetical protein
VVVRRAADIGILIGGGEATASDNLLQGNFIGMDANVMAAVPNLGGGTTAGLVFGNAIGGTTPAARNITSGNDGTGVLIELNQGGAAGHTSSQHSDRNWHALCGVVVSLYFFP